MNLVVCERWREALAMRALGKLPSDESTGLGAHLEGCRDCAAMNREMTETVSILGYVDSGAVSSVATVPPLLLERVLGGLHRSDALRRRQRVRRAILLVGAGAVAASALVVGFTLVNPAPAPPERTLALHGASSVQATAVLVSEPWGTTLKLRERGLSGGHVYTVSMKAGGGTWWTVGTYRGVADHPVTATMACAASFHSITSIRVVNEAGLTVLVSGTSRGQFTYG